MSVKRKNQQQQQKRKRKKAKTVGVFLNYREILSSRHVSIVVAECQNSLTKAKRKEFVYLTSR